MAKIFTREVKRAYDKIGYTPKTHTTIDVVGQYCCGLGALYLDSHTKNKDINTSFTTVSKWADRKFGKSYVNGFIEGFDNFRLSLKDFCPGNTSKKHYWEGVKDGKRIASILNKEGKLL